MRDGKIKKIMVVLVVLTAIFSFAAEAAAAEGDPTVLAPLPGVADKAGDTTTFNQYIPAIFNLAIGLSAVFAVFMIVVGGLQYMSTDAIQKKSDGKERIKNSVYGLIMVICAYLVLYTINPNLLKLDLNIETISIKSDNSAWSSTASDNSVSTAGVAMTPEQIKASDEIRQYLSSNNVYTYRSACTEGQTTGCVNLNGLSNILQGDLIAFNNACDASGSDCAVSITGGTEAGHSTNSLHNYGQAVDLSKSSSSLNSYIQKNYLNKTEVNYKGTNYTRYTLNVGGDTMYFLDEGNHWHVSIIYGQ